jgi:Zn-dependent M28 family amino/carboxypeptidase
MPFPAFRALTGSSSLLLILALCGCNTHPKVPPSTDIDETVYRDGVRVLASDDFEGRKPGTRGEEKTVTYLAEQFKRLGLKPGNGQSYVQNVPLAESSVVALSMSVLGQNGVHRLEQGRDVVVFSKRAGDRQELNRSDLVFAGYGIVAPEFTWNDYAGLDVHGKTVMILSGDPGPASKDPTLFQGNALSPYSRFQYKIEEAARQGAAAVLVVHDPAGGYGWNVVENTWGGAQFRLSQANEAEHPLIEGFISQQAARDLASDAGLDFADLAKSAFQRGFVGRPLNSKVNATLQSSNRTFASANVIGVLPGQRHKDEYVIYVAHWDSLGMSEHNGVRTVFTGAVDDASGVAGLLAMAQSFQRTQPGVDRTIVFLATTAAEPNLLGISYYMQNPVLPLAQTAAFLDLDSFMPGGRTRDISVFGFGISELDRAVREAALVNGGRETHPDPFPELGLYYRSESYLISKEGVPSLYAVAGIDDSARGRDYGKAKRMDYLAHFYRQPTDQYSPDWDVGGALEDLTMYYEVGGRVSNTRQFPRWTPNGGTEGRSRRREGREGAPPREPPPPGS